MNWLRTGMTRVTGADAGLQVSRAGLTGNSVTPAAPSLFLTRPPQAIDPLQSKAMGSAARLLPAGRAPSRLHPPAPGAPRRAPSRLHPPAPGAPRRAPSRWRCLQSYESLQHFLPHFIQQDKPHAVLLAAKTVGVKAPPTIQTLIKRAVPFAPGSPDSGIRGTKQADHRNTYGGGDMHGAVIVGNHEDRLFQYGSQLLEASLPHKIVMCCPHREGDALNHASLEG